MPTDQKTTKAFCLADFKDAGSEREFAKGSTVDITAGEFTNYAAAGLVCALGDKPAPETASAA